MESEVYDETMEKINQFINKILQYTVNNTLLISEYKIQDRDYFLNYLRGLKIECNKGEIQQGEFYYVLPKCYKDGEPLSLMETYNNMVVLYYDKDRENVKETLKRTLTMYIAASSFTFYQMMIRRFVEDGYSYLLMPDTLEGAILVVLQKTGILVSNPAVEELRIGPLAVWKLKPSDVLLPRYSFVYITENGMEIEEISKDVIIGVLIKLYDELRKLAEKEFQNSPALKELIEEFLTTSIENDKTKTGVV